MNDYIVINFTSSTAFQEMIDNIPIMTPNKKLWKHFNNLKDAEKIATILNNKGFCTRIIPWELCK